MPRSEPIEGHRADGAASTRVPGIAGLGRALPPQTISSEEIAPHIGVDADWIHTRTGIRNRRRLKPEERLSDLAAEAGRQALDAADMDGGELDGVIVATMSQDEATPNTGPLVAYDLGAYEAAAWDLGLACTGFVAGMQQAAALIESERSDAVLVVGADNLTPHTDHEDKRTAGLFGDGAGAAVVTAGGAGRIGQVILRADATGADAITAPPPERKIHMDGQRVFQQAIRRMEESCHQVLEQAELELDDIDLVIPHQANGRIVTALRERLGLPVERVADYIADLGNTSAATIPLALSLASEDGSLPHDGRVLVTAFGGGFAWGAALIEWGEPT